MGVLSPIIYALVAAALYGVVSARFTAEEQRWLRISFALHVFMAFANVFLTQHLLGGGDMFWYHRAGSQLADLWWSDPVRWTPELLKLTLRMKAEFPFWVHGAAGENATGAMFGLSAWLMIITGNSLYGACVILSVLNFFSRLTIYAVLKRSFSGQTLQWMLWALLLFPSALFWTGGLLKESVSMVGIGLAIYGAYRLAEHSDFLRGSLLIALGGFPAYLVKPYVLLPLLMAAPLWYLAAKMKRDSDGAALLLTPWRMVIAVALGMVGLALLGRFVPSLAVDNLSDELMSAQASWDRVSSSATAYSIMDAETRQRGLGSQLLYAPLGLLFSLTRPWIFEARSPQMLLAAVEMTGLVGLVVLSVRRLGVGRWLAALVREPVILFLLTYTVIFGTAVGLGTGNIGSLSRYRVPMLAAYGVVVVYLYCLPLTAGVSATQASAVVARQASARRRPLRVRRGPPRLNVTLRKGDTVDDSQVSVG